ncbi:hypothetical protein SADUNF_Sadunf02G0114600 [Salix dunnii]|uniref:Leucine zipper homeobox-associated domain-containing protein n=1 Tax=Salix dunnii TaxID=1413687 RepID=A0A835THM0_9ROSI|nr:hypothetical protein SADUNF_Sadunf02G0114600 [Salix dunnii]
MGDKNDGLGLSLSLGYATQRNHHRQPSLKLNLMPLASQNKHKKTSWTNLFQSPDRACDTRLFQRGIDMNRVPAAVADHDDETVVSSPNSTLSSLSGKRSEGEQIGEETEAERASCSRGSDDEDGDAFRKKLRLSKEQSLVLEETFKEHNTLNPVSSSLWANLFFFFFLLLGWFLIPALVSFGEVRGGFVVAEGKAGFGKTVESQAKASGGVVSEQKGKVTYFPTLSGLLLAFSGVVRISNECRLHFEQAKEIVNSPGLLKFSIRTYVDSVFNMYKTKLKQTEVDCEYLKRYCENLTEENRRLQKEVQELRALKLSPQLYMHVNPPTTLTMCPSCKRVVPSAPSSSAAVVSSALAPIASTPQPQRPVPINPWAAMPIHH